jgi:large conductance mechanosensitive channel
MLSVEKWWCNGYYSQAMYGGIAMSLAKEFREFAVKGNVVDMAVGIIIGAAFGKIVSSLVSDVIMPPIGILVGGVDFSSLAITLREGVPAVGAAPAVAPVLLKYGVFIQSIVDFLIVGGSVFMMVKLINRLKRKEAETPAAPPAPSSQEIILADIRELLRAQQTAAKKIANG